VQPTVDHHHQHPTLVIAAVISSSGVTQIRLFPAPSIFADRKTFLKNFVFFAAE